MNGFFSIISPSFNQAEFISRTLESVANQSTPPLEHLILDPGSTDHSREIAADYAAKHPFARLITNPDRGQADAINRGLMIAKGLVGTWLNTDDTYADSSVLEIVASVFQDRPEVDVVYGRGDFVDKEGKLLRHAYMNADPRDLPGRLIDSVGILQPALFFRTQLFREVGGIDTSLNCAFDHELWLSFAGAGATFFFLDRVLAKATFHDEAKSSALRVMQLKESAVAASRYCGVAPSIWISRALEAESCGTNFIVEKKAHIKPSPDVAEATRLFGEFRFKYLNRHNSALRALAEYPVKREISDSRRVAAAKGLADHGKVFATTFDTHYFPQGLTLIHGIRTYHETSIPVLVYDLNLTLDQRTQLACLENVHLVDYDRSATSSFDGFMSPKNYGYKCEAIADAARFVRPGGTVLWIDAGVVPLRRLDPIFEQIERDEIFFVDHDDRPNWPFYNATFCHPIAAKQIRATPSELLCPHLCSCLIGYCSGGKFQALIDQARSFARIKEIVAWTKHPLPEGTPEDPVAPRPPKVKQAREMVAEGRGGDSSLLQIYDIFGYLGHRQDQTIYSILAARHGAPISSAKQFCCAHDASSKASKLNWQSGSVSEELVPNSEVTTEVVGAVTFHHRGTYTNDSPVSQKRTRPARTLVILGNGPSLRGFDFARLRNFDVVGMNAAYRYWDEIGWYPRFYICLDKVVGLSHQPAISRLIRNRREYGIELFVLRANLISVLDADLQTLPEVQDFDKLRTLVPALATIPLTTGSHSAILGGLLGYSRLCLMGIDCNYVEQVAGSKERGGTVLEIVETTASNPNYFFDAYQKAGDLYNIPNPEPDLHLESWRTAGRILKTMEVTVWNGSAISAVDAFPKRDFAEVENEDRLALESETLALASSVRIPADAADRFLLDLLKAWDPQNAGMPDSIEETKVLQNASGLVMKLREPRGYLREAEVTTLLDRLKEADFFSYAVYLRKWTGVGTEVVILPTNHNFESSPSWLLAFKKDPSLEKIRELMRENAPAVLPDLVSDATNTNTTAIAAAESSLGMTFDRWNQIQVSEIDLILEALGDFPEVPKVMLDVGAHRGGSMKKFLEQGWMVYGFEPDHSNYQSLRQNFLPYLYSGKLILDRRAVSDHIASQVPFFHSNESTGIGSMLDFTTSHDAKSTVLVTSISDVLAERKLPPTGFLKIDAEGFDFFVLRGYPWGRDRPAFIMAEFEDAKTSKLLYTVEDMVKFLEKKGYTIFLSEWHPILAYGISHEWRAFWKAGSHQLAENAWGNLIAVRKDLDSAPVLNALNRFYYSVKKD